MSSYKEELNNIHAPEDLILRTLSRVHEEEQKVQAEKAQIMMNQTENVETQMNQTENAQTGMKEADNKVTRFYIDESYSGQSTDANEDFYSQYGTGKKRGKLGRIIVTFSSIVAAAVVLIIAMNAGLFRGGSMDSATSYETTQASNEASDMSTSDSSSEREKSSKTSSGAREEAAADETMESADDDMNYSYESTEAATEASYSDEECETTADDSAKDERPQDVALAGGWQASESSRITGELSEIFDKGIENYTGNECTPVFYLGSQIVSGTNHAFLCKTKLGDDQDEYWSIVYIYEDLEGNCTFIESSIIDLALSSEDTVVQKSSGDSSNLMGGWSACENYEIDSDVKPAIDEAIDSTWGADIEPVAILGSQVVAGNVYAVLCRETSNASDAQPYWCILYIYRDLQNNGSVLNNATLSLAN
ncbi:hypothetical protein SAMN02910369_00782 [Lachnospiraceae bacterium NE2001]|nr:hypothetical protein SAMN02910369_00782 [Lachnospiraceae bacterium NE2001]